MDWLNNATTSNRLRQTYVSGFMDVSGGNVTVRNGDLLAYGNVVLGGPTSIVNVFGTASFEQAPIMNGANIIPGSIPPYAIGGGGSGGGTSFSFVDTGSAQSVGGNKTFNGDISMNRNVGIGNGSGSSVRMDASTIFIGTASAQTISIRGNTTFTNAPFMSGANITAVSIPQGSIVGGGIIVDVSSIQSISGIKTFVGDVSMIGNVVLGNIIRSVNIGGNTTMARGVTVLNDLSMTSATGLLSVNGNLSLINPNRVFTVAGNSNLNGNLTVARDFTVNGNTRIDGSLNANGNVILGDSNLDRIMVHGISTFGNSVLMNRNLTVEGVTSVVSLTASGNIISPCMVGDGSSIYFLGNTSFGVNNANNVFQGTITANGNVFLYGSNIQIGDASSEMLNIYSNTIARSDVAILGNVATYGNTTIGDTTTDTLIVNSVSILQGNVRVNQDISLCRNIVLGDNSTNTVLVKGNTTFETAPFMSGANITTQTIPQRSIVGGTSGFVDLSSSQIVSGIKHFTSDVSMAGNVVVGGTQSNINIKGYTKFDRPPVMSGASMELNSIPLLSLVGGANGIMDLSTNQTINGRKIFQGDVSMCGNVLIGDTSLDIITIMGATTFDMPPIMSGANIATGTIPASAISGGGGGQVDGSFVDLSTNQFIGGKKTFISDLSVNTNAYLSDTSYGIFVRGKATFYNDVSMNGNVLLGDASNDRIIITGNSTFNGDASFNGNIWLGDGSNDTIHFVGKPVFTGDMSLNGNVQCGDASNDTLLVIGKSTFNSDMTINGNLNLNGGLQIGRVKQIINGDLSGNYSGFYRLAKYTQPSVSKMDSSNIVSNWNMGRLSSSSTDNIGMPTWSPWMKLFAVGSSSQTAIWTSPDTITWTQRTISGTDINSRWSIVVASKDAFYAFSRVGSNRVAISTDGVSWSCTGSSPFLTGSNLYTYSTAIYVEDLSKIIATSADTGSVLNGRIPTYKLNTQTWEYKEYNNDANDNALNAITWAGDIYTLCVVGAGVISISTDGGENWGSTLVNSNYVFNSVCWSSDLGLFIAGGRKGTDNGCILVSSNGIQWTETFLISSASTGFTSCSWSDEMKIACVIGPGFLAYSYNGVNWIYTTHGFTNASSIIWAKEMGLFLMTGNYMSSGTIPGQFATTNLNSRPLTTLNMFQHTYNRIDQSGNWYFKKMGISGTGAIQSGFDFDVSGSTVLHGNTVVGDASNFAFRVGAKSQFLTDASFEGGNIYIGGNNVSIGNVSDSLAVVQTNKRMLQSLGTESQYRLYNGYYGLAKDAMPTYKQKDLITALNGSWTSRRSTNTTTTGAFVWNADYKYVSFVGGISTIYESTTDAMTFSTSSPAPAVIFTCCAYSTSLTRMVFLSNAHTTRAYYRTNNPGSVPNSGTISSTYPWTSVVWSDELSIFVAVSSSITSTGGTATSSDGMTWTTNTSPFTSSTPLLSVSWSPELKIFCAVGYSGVSKSIATSTNGTGWSKISVDASLNSICWSSKFGRFVAAGENIIYWSSNAVNWNVINIPSVTFRNIIWVDQYSAFVASCATSATIYYSFDGITWNNVNTILALSGVVLLNISWIEELGLFLANSSSAIYTSDLRYRHPSSKAVFNHLFGNIDQNGNLFLKGLGVNRDAVTAGYVLDVNGSLNISGTGVANMFTSGTAAIGKSTVGAGYVLDVNGSLNISGTGVANMFTSGTAAIGKSTVSAGYQLDVNGNINATSYNATSDYRLKTNILPLDTQINTILSLEPKTFVWKKDGRFDSGFIAQEVFHQFPHLRIGDSTGDEPVDASGNPLYLAFDYSKLTPYLWKGMQELINKVNHQESEIAELKRRLGTIE